MLTSKASTTRLQVINRDSCYNLYWEGPCRSMFHCAKAAEHVRRIIKLHWHLAAHWNHVLQVNFVAQHKYGVPEYLYGFWCSYKVVRHNVQQFNMDASASIISVTCLVSHMYIFHHISVDICTMVHMMHRERERCIQSEEHTNTQGPASCFTVITCGSWIVGVVAKNSSIQVLETRLWSAVERVERWRNHQQHWWVQPLASAKQAENHWRSLPRRCQWAELARIPRVPKTRNF